MRLPQIAALSRGQWSLRWGLVALGFAGVTTGLWVNAASRQRAIVAAIEAAGGTVSYYPVTTGSITKAPSGRMFLLAYGGGRPSSRSPLHRILGDDFLSYPVAIDFQDRSVDKSLLNAIATLKDIQFLQFDSHCRTSSEMASLQAKLPQCYVCDVNRPAGNWDGLNGTDPRVELSDDGNRDNE